MIRPRRALQVSSVSRAGGKKSASSNERSTPRRPRRARHDRYGTAGAIRRMASRRRHELATADRRRPILRYAVAERRHYETRCNDG